MISFVFKRLLKKTSNIFFWFMMKARKLITLWRFLWCLFKNKNHCCRWIHGASHLRRFYLHLSSQVSFFRTTYHPLIKELLKYLPINTISNGVERRDDENSLVYVTNVKSSINHHCLVTSKWAKGEGHGELQTKTRHFNGTRDTRGE